MLLLIRIAFDVVWDDLEVRNLCAEAVPESLSAALAIEFHFGCMLLLAGPAARNGEPECSHSADFLQWCRESEVISRRSRT